LLKQSDAGRAVFLTSGVAAMARAYWGPYSVSKTALETLVRTYAAETATTNVRANLFGPGPTRTRMYLSACPGIDPETLPPPQQIAEAIVPLCLPSFAESGKLYDYRSGRLLSFPPPA
jgi:NAD(P)-dependent dehydrogenase (short-subunit alcohol dehydrogenase family)